jgi:hypothetical protein
MRKADGSLDGRADPGDLNPVVGAARFSLAAAADVPRDRAAEPVRTERNFVSDAPRRGAAALARANLRAAAALIGLAAAFPAHGADWHAIKQNCVAAAVNGPTCNYGTANGCPSWNWLSVCIALNLPGSTPALREHADRCIASVLSRQNAQRTFGVKYDDQHIAEVMACLGVK